MCQRIVYVCECLRVNGGRQSSKTTFLKFISYVRVAKIQNNKKNLVCNNQQKLSKKIVKEFYTPYNFSLFFIYFI